VRRSYNPRQKRPVFNKWKTRMGEKIKNGSSPTKKIVAGPTATRREGGRRKGEVPYEGEPVQRNYPDTAVLVS